MVLEQDYILHTQFVCSCVLVHLGLNVNSQYEPSILICDTKEGQHIEFTETEWCQFMNNPKLEFMTFFNGEEEIDVPDSNIFNLRYALYRTFTIKDGFNKVIKFKDLHKNQFVFSYRRDTFNALCNLNDCINFKFIELAKYSIYAKFQHSRIVNFFLKYSQHYPGYTVRNIPNSLLKPHSYLV